MLYPASYSKAVCCCFILFFVVHDLNFMVWVFVLSVSTFWPHHFFTHWQNVIWYFIFQKTSPYLTWGCADDLTCRLKKTLYYSDENDCYESSSAALTGIFFAFVKKSMLIKITFQYFFFFNCYKRFDFCLLVTFMHIAVFFSQGVYFFIDAVAVYNSIFQITGSSQVKKYLNLWQFCNGIILTDSAFSLK